MATKSRNGAIVNKVVALSQANTPTAVISAVIPSIGKSTIAKIRKSEADRIAEGKALYIKLIDRTTGGDKKQSEVLAGSLNAETELYNFKGEVVGTRPDYKTRLDTIKYIDKLKGRDNPSVQVNTQINNTINSVLDRYSK